MSAGTKRTRVAVVTTSRADFGIYRPVLDNLSASPRIEPGLIATGMHLSPAFGLTISEVEASGFPVWAKPACMLPDEGVVAAAASAGKAVEVVGRALAEVQPDLVMVLGDRYEMLAGALAANILALPLAHIHGGEETLGANDNAFRHAITKLSHLHFAATPAAADRILQMGEQPSSVFVVGAPAIDVMSTTERVAREELLRSVGLEDAPFVLVALHPETLSRIPVETMIESVWSAVMSTGLQILVTGANADVMGRTINEVWAERCAAEPKAAFVMSLGTKRFWSAMSHAAVMVGNSSSGIIEAASFHLPVVNIGDRQLGRERSGNVIDCGFEEAEIRHAISRATGDAFRDSLTNLVNVYGDGHAGARIRAALEQVRDPATLLQKKFHDYGDRTGSSPHGPGRMPLA